MEALCYIAGIVMWGVGCPIAGTIILLFAITISYVNY